MKKLFYLILMITFSTTTAQVKPEPYSFEVEIKKEIKAEKYQIMVPENRSDKDSRMIPITFIKLKSSAKKPGNPIIYLAGGPGGSGTRAMKGQRWLMFEQLRKIADVIILDQRGTGLSDQVPRCQSAIKLPADQPTNKSNYIKYHRQAARECLKFWESQNVDIKGYTTWESAADINAVRNALNVDRVDLLGISYGTHLALATLKRYPDHIGKLVLASAEGLDHTVKLPSLTDAYFDRLQAAIDQQPQAKQAYPDVKILIKKVLNDVENKPKKMLVDDDPEFYHTLGKFEMQRITGYMLADPRNAASILEGYLDASNGDFSWFKNYLDWYVGSNEISLNGMSLAMDMASGISNERLQQVNNESKTAVLGDAINFPMPHLIDIIDGIDLGDDFRKPFYSDRPALFLSGTLDGRTYPEAHANIAQRFENAATITIENAGHNLFFSHPDLIKIITNFFDGNPPRNMTLTAPMPNFIKNK